ncbi:Stf0 sulfotransferase family protein [Gilvimarinus agarilyticus]|uniref:Stf0 family sulfotransferase n=1 Tax=Gilvimarinus sp. 2_MG-2023 TaxID=3062666 RepID=UPI001C08AE6C|nr:Stf0 family sulfotransferase [Gilvimarinus sp. 2_MG-2023]MBU2887883.1 Stf0 sulfotransferase family protein [Gilvimarinus agarilyticus]MDO6572521.1 Stf0 family sulfotransferase [Gilvimarinus sp. 2_MG-2023]
MNSDIGMYGIPYNISPHGMKIVEYFGLENVIVTEPDDRFSRYKHYILGFTNRSGSNYLAEMIAGDARYSPARESLCADMVIEKSKEHGFKRFSDYLFWLVESTTEHGHAFGAKASFGQLSWLAATGVFENCFPQARIIHMKRENVVAQALSLSIARQTKQWMSTQKSKINSDDISYNPVEINRFVKEIVRSNAEFEGFFLKHSIDPVEVSYEDFCNNTEQELGNIYRALGFFNIGLTLNINGSKLLKQAGTINQSFEDRFKQENRIGNISNKY